MANTKLPKDSNSKIGAVKKRQSFREQASKARRNADKPRRLRKTARSISRPFKIVVSGGRREYYLPLPDSKLGRFLNKRRRLIPRYFREAWAELRQVTWPTRRETWKLTFAVFTFAFIFGLLVAITDYGLDKLFKKVLLKS